MLPAWMWVSIAVIATAAIWIMNHVKAPKYLQLFQREGIGKIRVWLPLMLDLIKPLQPTLDTESLLVSIRQAQLQLYGPVHAYNRFRIFIAELVLMLTAGLIFGCVLAAVADGTVTNMLTGSVFGVVLMLVRVKDTLDRAERRREDLQMELPELLSKVTLLVQAGETVQKALQTCLQRNVGKLKQDHPLYRELERVMKDVQHGHAFAHALEQFAKRCSVQEVSMFATTLLLNQRKGGSSFVLAMQELSRQLWEKRKQVARIRGEEASTKLIIPVMLMFLVVLMVVGGPAFLMM